jgi:hypothetical protein
MVVGGEVDQVEENGEGRKLLEKWGREEEMGTEDGSPGKGRGDGCLAMVLFCCWHSGIERLRENISIFDVVVCERLRGEIRQR